MMEKLSNEYILQLLQSRFAAHIQGSAEPHGLLTIEVAVSKIIDVLSYLKDTEALRFNYLTDITAVHYPKQEEEFAIVYHVHNMFQNIRVRVKTYVTRANPSVPTATVLWKGANWMERETYDFYGIHFEGHPDLRRILNMDELDVFPMRKEYPLEDPNRVDKKDFYFGR
jgi:NADH-quinone oxidoreductase subunit C